MAVLSVRCEIVSKCDIRPPSEASMMPVSLKRHRFPPARPTT